MLKVNNRCIGHYFLKNWFARSLLIWTILWLQSGPSAIFGARVFPRLLSVLQNKTVNSHRADYNMLDKFYPVWKNTARPWWGSHSHRVGCGLWGMLREYGQSFSQPRLQLSLTQALCSQRLLLFVFKGSLDIRWFYKRQEGSICIYLYAFVGKIIMVEQASNFVKIPTSPSLISRTLMP